MTYVERTALAILALVSLSLSVTAIYLLRLIARAIGLI